MMTPEATLILSTSELRLGLNLVGCSGWDDLPVIQTEESIEQKMMNAFLHLVETGQCISGGSGYLLLPEFRQQMLHIGQADRAYQVFEEERIRGFIYEKNGQHAVISPDWGNPQGCRLSNFGEAAAEDIVSWLARSPEQAKELVLRQAEKSPGEQGQYDMEKLAYFLGAGDRTEDSE